MKRALIIISLTLLAVMGSVLASLNANEVVFNYYFSSLSLPLALLLLLVLALGALAGVLFSLALVLNARRERAHLRRRLEVCEQEIKNLRDIPIKGPY